MPSPSPALPEIGFSLGSNLGDRVAHLRAAAKALLAADPSAELAGKSSLWETEPVDVRPEFQHLKFLNAVLILRSALPPRTWLAHIGDIERRFGRARIAGDKNAPRELDIDIIFAGDELIGTGALVVPHPRWAQRRFVVQPLAELRPNRILPGAARSVADILDTLPGAGDLQRLDEVW
jgi:2-amino-4-hydroxy-6-hydroxymethyldihydropteridine diphosphokinase